MASELDAALEGLQGLIQREVSAFEALDELLELGQGSLKIRRRCHGRTIGEKRSTRERAVDGPRW